MAILTFGLLSSPQQTLRDWLPKIRLIARRRPWLAEEFELRTWSPLTSAGGSMTAVLDTVRHALYLPLPGDNLVWYSFCLGVTLGGVASNELRVSLPLSAPDALLDNPRACGGVGGTQSGRISISTVGYFSLYKNDFTNYTLGGELVYASGVYWRSR